MNRPAALGVAAVLAVAGAACGGHEGTASTVRLLDGSRSARIPVPLSGLGSDAVLARVRILRADRLDARGSACVDSFRGEYTVANDAVVVERTGATGASLTFADARRHAVLGCDRTGRRRAGGTWCARSVGRLVAGTLEDARLDILCVDGRGAPVGFAWLEPVPAARWVAVAGPKATEVEQVAAGLPIRIATGDVDSASSSATFAVSEFDATGHELVRYRMRARVAG